MTNSDATEQPRTQTDWVEQQLRRSLLAGEFAPDERLSPKDLSLRWSVSSTPLREAMNRLGAEGLLKIVPQKGVRVAPISIDEMFQIYEIRLLIEPVALQRSVEQGTDQWLERVQDAWARFRPLHEAPLQDMLQYEQAHEDFHTALLSACGSEWTLRTISHLSRQSSRFRLLSARGGPAAVGDEHLDIFEAAQDGRAADAAALHTEHLLRTMESSDPASGIRLRDQFDSDCNAIAKRLDARRPNQPE